MSARLPPALLVLVASLTLAQLPRSSPAPTPTFVPYPRSLHLLDAVEGTRGDEPHARRTDYPDRWEGTPAFDPRASGQLLATLLDAVDRELELLRELRRLALDGLQPSLPLPLDRPLRPAEAAQAFQRRLQALERLVREATFRGHALLTAATPEVVLFQPPPSDLPMRVVLSDLSPAAHGLVGLDLRNPAAAGQALDLLDTAIYVLRIVQNHYVVELERFEAGRPAGGLSAVAELLDRMSELATLAADATRSDNERALLDAHFQALVARLDATSFRASFRGIPLLSGVRVRLEGAGRPGRTELVTLPNTGVEALGVWTDITDVGNALDALQRVGAAQTEVEGQRRAVAAARERLERGTAHTR